MLRATRERARRPLGVFLLGLLYGIVGLAGAVLTMVAGGRSGAGVPGALEVTRAMPVGLQLLLVGLWLAIFLLGLGLIRGSRVAWFAAVALFSLSFLGTLYASGVALSVAEKLTPFEEGKLVGKIVGRGLFALFFALYLLQSKVRAYFFAGGEGARVASAQDPQPIREPSGFPDPGPGIELSAEQPLEVREVTRIGDDGEPRYALWLLFQPGELDPGEIGSSLGRAKQPLMSWHWKRDWQGERVVFFVRGPAGLLEGFLGLVQRIRLGEKQLGPVLRRREVQILLVDREGLATQRVVAKATEGVDAPAPDSQASGDVE